MSGQTQKQGKCDRCRICWTWDINVPLSRQICLGCNGPLARITRAVRNHPPYTWICWDGYNPPALATRRTI